MTAFDLACSVPWAITEDALQTILDIADRTHSCQSQADWEALASKLGKNPEYSRKVDIDEETGVATIPVDGPIFRKANMFTRYSGATSADVLLRDIRSSLSDPEVRSIVLSIDSPGGEVAGTHDVASAIHAARGKKPIVAHVWGSGASAAYWIASAADSIVATPTALLGSIGVIATHRLRKDPKEVQFVSSVSPHKRPDLETDAGRAQVQALVDRAGAIFVDEVARYRGVSRAHVLRHYGRGDVLTGADALRPRLADALGTHDDVSSALASGRIPGQRLDPFGDFLHELSR